MLGLIVQVLISWILIWLFERGNLTVLGLTPTGKRLGDFLGFFVLTAFFCSSGFLLKAYFGNQEWHLNPDITPGLLFDGSWWNLKSVLFEELIFRGVILYILIKRLGVKTAITISATAFGIYHWFSFGVFGQIPAMAIVFVTTAAMGVVLAYGYAKTLSLYIPIAIHLGWNLTQIFVFSQGPIGNGLFVQANPTPFRTGSYLIFFCVTFLPIIFALGINFLLIKKREPVYAGNTKQ